MKMRNLMALFLILCCVTVHEGFAQGTDIITKDSLKDSYLKSLLLKRQIGKIQVTSGSVLAGAGAVMIGTGVYMRVNHTGGKDAEGNPLPSKVKRNGQGLIVAGTVIGVASAFLIKKGIDRLKTFKNPRGEVVSEITLSDEGFGGLSLKF